MMHKGIQMLLLPGHSSPSICVTVLSLQIMHDKLEKIKWHVRWVIVM